MAKSQTSYATNASNNLINQAQGLTAPIQAGFQSSLGTAQANQASELNTATAGINTLQNEASTGGFTSAQSQLLAQGGYNPAQLSQVEGGYSNLATTGGYTPQQAQQFVQQATEGTEATYGALEQQAKQGAVATGGLGTGGGLSQMARQLSQAQGTNTLNAEVALNQSETSNKLAGLGGESNIMNQVATNKLQGAEAQAGNTLQGTEAANTEASQLYSTTTGQVTALGNQILQTLGLNFSTQAEAINALTQLSKNPGAFQTAIGDLTAAGGAAAGGAAAGG
jgi:hypothetical protein